jgi:hypothetical protein
MHGIPVALLYVPPGKQSSVGYSTGSTMGTIFQMQFQSGSSNTVQLGFSILGNGVQGNSTYVTGTINGSSTSITKVTSAGVTATNSGYSDFPDHGYDTLFIWSNPATTLWLLENGTIIGQSWQTSDSQPINVVPFTIRELNGTDYVTDNVKRAYFSNYTSIDKTSFVGLDPFSASSSPALNPNRYQKVASGQWFYGPDHAQDPALGTPYTWSYNTANNTINGSYVNQSSTVIVSAGLDLGIFHIGGSTTTIAQQNFMETRTNTTGNQQQASATLKTPTIGCAIKSDVYIDAAFSTYLVIPTQSSGC